jgi:5-methylcytosine-specific restriction endonuclease McrA
MIETKRCKRCDEVKPLDEFSAHRKYRDGRDHRCKGCRVKYRQLPENKAKQAVHYSSYKVKQSGLEVEDTLTSHQVGFTLSEGSCIYCQEPLEYTEATVDHIIPLSRGGRNTFDNIGCACSKCNRNKYDRPAILFMLQSCEPYANRKLLERMALRSGRTVPEIYELLAKDVQAFFAIRVVSST